MSCCASSVAILRDLAVADQRGAAERREVDVELDVRRDAERRGDARARPRPRGRAPDRTGPSARRARSPRRAAIAPAV